MSMKLANDPWLSPGVENTRITSVELRRFHYSVESEAQDNKTGAHQMIRMQPIRDDYLQLMKRRLILCIHVSLYIFVFMFHYIVHTCMSINT